MKQESPKRNILQSGRLYAQYVFNRYALHRKLDYPPILIVGCGHSGTTLLLAMLGAHPELFPVSYETYFGFELDREARSLILGFEREALALGRRSWIEKTPKHIMCIPRLLDLAPQSKILLIIRDGRDVAISIKRRNGSLEKGISRWVEHNREGQKYWSDPRVMRLKYEDLVLNTETCLREIFQHMEVPFSPTCLEYHKQTLTYYSDKVEKPESAAGEDHAQYRNWQINQPVFNGSGKWKEMSMEEKSIFKDRSVPC